MTIKLIEQTNYIISPVQPTEAVSSESFHALLRDKLNEVIEVLNSLRMEVIELKKRK